MVGRGVEGGSAGVRSVIWFISIASLSCPCSDMGGDSGDSGSTWADGAKNTWPSMGCGGAGGNEPANEGC